MTAYYNENDPFTAAWLRDLIRANLIASGEVDERSIEEVKPEDLRGFTQCHFFAGIGVWSYALRAAGWPDDSPVWTGSCPCQGFSASGQRGGFSDKRHLWPAWFRLIRECRPDTIFGEQVASKDGLAWLDVVSADLENENYAIGAIDTCAASVGAPHIRQRLYFVADSLPARRAEWRAITRDRSTAGRRIVGHCGNTAINGGGTLNRQSGQSDESQESLGRSSVSRNGEGMGHGSAAEPASSTSNDLNPFQSRLEGHAGNVREWRGPGWLDPITARSVAEAGATRGFWNDCDWWYGRDEKYRPIGAGLFPLVNGATGRMGLLRGYGNAIVPQVAEAFISSYMEICGETKNTLP